MKQKIIAVFFCITLILSMSVTVHAFYAPNEEIDPVIISEPTPSPSASPELTDPDLSDTQPSHGPGSTAQPSDAASSAEPSPVPDFSPSPSVSPVLAASVSYIASAQSTDITLPFSVTRKIDIQDQYCSYNDFNFTLSENSWINIRQTNEESEYYILNLINSEGKVIGVAPAKSNLCDLSFERIIYSYLPAGQYTLRVLRDETRGFAAGDYTLSITTETSDAYDLSEYNLAMQANSPDHYWHFDNDSRGLDRTAGNIYKTLAVWSRAKGPVNEPDDPYMLYYYDHEDIDDVNLLDGSSLYYHDLAPSYMLSKAIMLPPRTSFTDNAHYKNIIQNYGALYAGILELNEFFTDGEKYFYCPVQDSYGTGHAVTLIGWDDTVPKENFTVSYEGNTYTPPIDGAFIAKNSYSPQTGNDGYFYISYGSYCFSNNAATAIILSDISSCDNVNTIYHNDPLGMTNNSYSPEIFIGSNAYTKDIFTASGDQTICEIGIYLTAPEECYEIYLTKNGVKTAVASGQKEYGGYYRIKLASPYKVKSGEEFTVETHFSSKNGNNFVSAAEMPITPYYSRASAQPGTSFFSKDGKNYTDISDLYDANNCIKVYALDSSKAADTIFYGNIPAEESPQKVFRSDELIDVTKKSPPLSSGSAGISLCDISPAPVTYLSPSFDLSSIGAVTKVKNQSLIPSCWSFASCASAESILLRNDIGFSGPMKLSLDKTSETITISNNTLDFELTSFVSPSDSGNNEVYYNFSGDLGSIDILSYKSVSGERTALFTAKDAGIIHITAVCAADTTKTAQATIEIKKTQPPVVPTAAPTSAPDVSDTDAVINNHVPKTGDAANLSLLITVLAALFIAEFVLLFIKNIKKIK